MRTGAGLFTLDDRARRDLVAAVRKAQDPGKTLLDYCRDDFDPGSASPVIAAAFEEVRRGRGVALVRGLPREGLDEKTFELLTWAIGLHAGVGRPQGKASHYMSAVRDAGTAYRTGTGRGYSSNAELDFHTDSADVVGLACYNKAAAGGMSITTSSPAAYERMKAEHPDLAEWLRRPVHFSRQGEQAADEAPSYPHPIFDEAEGRLFSKWNWNRVTSAQKLEGVPRIPAEQWKALETFDQIVRRPDLAHTMWLEPGDLQIINSHVHAAFAHRFHGSRRSVGEAAALPAVARAAEQRPAAGELARALQGRRARHRARRHHRAAPRRALQGVRAAAGAGTRHDDSVTPLPWWA